MILPLKYGNKNSMVSLGLALLLLLPSVRVLGHAGHGDEFNHNQPSQPTGAIDLDSTTAERIGLKIEPVTRQSLDFGVQATGRIETSPRRRVEVTNPVGGTVIKLLVEPGDLVKAGQSLAVITSGELAELRITALENAAERQGDIQQAEANLRLAKQRYERQQKIAATAVNRAKTELRVAQERYNRDKELAGQGAIPRREFLESDAHLASARQAVAEAEGRLEVWEAQTEVERTQTTLQVAQSRAKLSAGTYQTRLQQLGAEANSDGTITIKAPISGGVADRKVTIGQSIEDAGMTLMTLVDDRTVLATANIYEKDLNQISQGQRVRVKVSSLPNKLFEGRITIIGSVVEAENRVVPVKAELENGDKMLKPGMFAELEVLTDRTSEPIVAIPQSAIIEANSQPIVFVQNGNQFQAVEVTLGRQAGNLVEVASGLFEGDRIVTQRANQLYAQSLRGGSAKAEKAEATEVKDAGDKDASGAIGLLPEWGVVRPLPGWVLVSGSGALAIGTFAAGVFWTNWRNRRSFPAAMPVLEHREDSPNGHHGTLDSSSASLSSADPHHQNTKIPNPPHHHH